MTDEAARARTYGKVFNEIATTYDRNRPGYPEELIDRAVAVAQLEPGDAVLEVGCGTGQLTRDLLARGLHVTAVEPGERLAQMARTNLGGAGQLEFVNARLEDAQLPDAHFKAALSASAIHWVDPDVGWRILAEALQPLHGTLSLIQYVGLDEHRTADDQRDHLAIMQRVAPELANNWPTYRDLEMTLTGAQARQANISELWGWLCSYELSREYAVTLFGPAELSVVPVVHEYTATELTGLLSTMSFWSRLTPAQQGQIAEENELLQARLGRPLRSSTAACLVTARRAQ